MARLSLTHVRVPAVSGSAITRMQPGQAPSPLPSSSKRLGGALTDALVLMCPKCGFGSQPMAIPAFSCPSVKARG